MRSEDLRAQDCFIARLLATAMRLLARIVRILDAVAHEKFVEIWQRLFADLNLPMYLSRTPVSARVR